MPWDTGLVGSIATFAGGALISWDALAVAWYVRAQQGGDALVRGLARHGVGPILVTSDGKPLDSPEKLEVWMARRARNRAAIGFALITIGFLLDVVDRIVRLTST